MEKRITKQEVQAGFESGLIHLINRWGFLSNGERVVCEIGTDWFYFADNEHTHMTAEEYLRSTPMEDIVDEVTRGLEELREIDYDEWSHYRYLINARED